MTAPGNDARGSGLFERIEAIRAQRRTGLLEFEVREQRRALPFVGGELHLPPTHPHAQKWRDLLGRTRDPATLKAIGALLDQFVETLRDWGTPRGVVFHAGHARLPGELVGP